MGKVKKVKESSVEEVNEITEENVIVENVEVNEKKTKKERKKGEFKAFLILLLIIGLAVLGCWYWYNYVYDSDKGKENNAMNSAEGNNEQTSEEVNYKVISYETKSNLAVISGKYLIENTSKDKVKVLNMNAEVLYEGNIEYTDMLVADDGNLYAYLDEYSEYGNDVTLYKLEDKEFKEIVNLKSNSVYYSPLIYNGDGDRKLLGFVGYSSSNDAIDADGTIDNYVYVIGSENKSSGGVYLVGDDVRLSVDSELFTNSKRYVIAAQNISEKTLYGVYDLKNNEMAIEIGYERLYKNSNDTYIAIKDGKSGIIDINLKKKVDFKYDFIDVNDGYYVVGLDNKLAIMKDDYSFLTDFSFDYQAGEGEIEYSYLLCCAAFNTFESYKIKDKIVLVNNYNELYYRPNFKNHSAYVISSDGTYETIEQNFFDYDEDTGFIYTYSENDKKFTIYDKDLKKKFDIDISDYDFDDIPYLSLVNGNTITFDSSKSLFYDYADGKEIKEMTGFDYELENVKISYKSNDQRLTLTIGEEIKEFKVKDFDFYKDFKKYDENSYYIINGKTYIGFNKSDK